MFTRFHPIGLQPRRVALSQPPITLLARLVECSPRGRKGAREVRRGEAMGILHLGSFSPMIFLLIAVVDFSLLRRIPCHTFTGKLVVCAVVSCVSYRDRMSDFFPITILTVDINLTISGGSSRETLHAEKRKPTSMKHAGVGGSGCKKRKEKLLVFSVDFFF